MQPRTFALSERALDDLESIHDYISESDPLAADRFVDAISDKIAWIADARFNGVPRDRLQPGLRALPFRNYAIYFAIDGDHVRVLRILHGRRDLFSQDYISENDS